jgi:hypothetical protein
MTPPLNLIVVAPTFYSNVEDSRFILGLNACRQSVLHIKEEPYMGELRASTYGSKFSSLHSLLWLLCVFGEEK